MSTKSPLYFFSITLFVSSLILGGSLVFSTVRQTADVSATNDSAYIIEKQEPVRLTIINDSSCEPCSTDDIENLLKKQIGSPLAIRRFDYSSEDGKSLMTSNQAAFLPFLLLGPEIKEEPAFAHLTHHSISQSQDGYFVDLVKMGAPVGRYLDAAYYAKDDPAAPKAVAEKTVFDFGDLRLSEGKVSTEFIIKNNGESPLEFLNANTSCGCTSAQIVLPDETSPIYMMAGHQEPVEWRGTLAPGAEGKVVVFYDPTVHPDLNGAVTREVTIQTNDPNSPQLKFKIDVNQIPG